MEEAMLVFGNVSANQMCLRKRGVRWSQTEILPGMRTELRLALLSNESYGTWQLPPSDKFLRQYFVGKGLLSDYDAPTAEVYDALKDFSRSKGLPVMKTYNGRLLQCLHHRERFNPNRRL